MANEANSSQSSKLDVFKKAATAVIQIQKAVKPFVPLDAGEIKKERLNKSPGIDVLHPPNIVEKVHAPCKITVIDYDEESIYRSDLDNDSLSSFLENTKRSVNSKIRWINVEGISFDVVRTLTLNLHIHPLAVEDIFHIPQRVKLDVYDSFMLICMSSPTCVDSDDVTDGNTILLPGRSEFLRQIRLKKKLVQAFQSAGVQSEQCCFLLFQNGLVLSIFSSTGVKITANIYDRIYQKEMLLRKTCCAALLLHALVDGTVDGYFNLVQFVGAKRLIYQYESQVTSLQDLVILKPLPVYTKLLHLICKELGIIKRTLKPTEKLVENLKQGMGSLQYESQYRLYFSDVLDHCNAFFEDISIFESISRELIELTFNTISHETNESMRTLAVVSIVFLPITFLAGVYGMNFEYFPEIRFALGVFYFWIWAAISVVATLIAAFWLRWIKY